VRTAIVSDIHGNLRALDAVIADLRRTSPDVVLQGGDLATHGARPAQVIDRIRELGWAGVHGNTDEMLWAPELLDTLSRESPKLSLLFNVLFRELAPATRDRIGEDRITWLRGLPRLLRVEDIVVVHATAESVWKAPMPDATDKELARTYRGLAAPIVVFGHIHRPFVRQLADGLVIANAGSAGLPFDGDPRASYLLVDNSRVEIRRVTYDAEREATALIRSKYPRAAWIADILRTGRYTRPSSEPSSR